MKNILLSFIAGVISAGTVTAGDVPQLRVPLDISLLLSGNFGELRNNHFHSGVDFKTKGVTGLPVYAAADGYVSRVVVSPWGFGRAVYLTHPELGLTTVYGHLESFSQAIDTPVRKRQYDDETFSVDLEFGPGEITVKQGTVIGRSGNAGSSGGPHLHMDVRDTATGHALDPLHYYRTKVADNVAPEMRAVALYPREGMVNGGNKPVYLTPQTLSQGFTAWGRVVPGIKAYDRMSGTTNIYGVKYLTFKFDGREIYRRVIDRFDFNNTRAVNTLVDYGDVVNKGSWVMITEQPEAMPLNGMITSEGNGSVEIYEERDYPCEFIMEDEHGNRRSVKFTITGKSTGIVPDIADGELLAFDRDNMHVDGGVTVDIPAGTLYGDAIFSIDSTEAPGYKSRRFRIGDTSVPLAGNYRVIIPIDSDDIPDKSKYCLVRFNGKKRTSVSSAYHDGAVEAKVNRFGEYAVAVDTVAPLVKPVKPLAWGKNARVTYKISDALSGITSFRGEIDGKFALFELDGKTGTVTFRMDPSRFTRGKSHRVVMTVTDACGNVTTARSRFTW